MSTSNKKVLIVSEFHLIRTFLLPTIARLSKECNIVFECLLIGPFVPDQEKILTPYFSDIHAINVSNKKSILYSIPKIRFFLTIYSIRKAIRQLGDFEIIHIFFHHYYYTFFSDLLREKCQKLYITYFGSDFNGIERYKHFLNKVSISRAKSVFCNTAGMLLLVKAKYDSKTLNVSFDVLDLLMESFIRFEGYLKQNTSYKAKEAFNTSKRVIVCGYNAAPIVRHEIIFNAIEQNASKLSGYKIIFPMTYGHLALQTRTLVRRLTNSSSQDYTILEDYLPIEKVLELRLACDIFINIQSRDQMAASMLEHLAAGSIVITGKWLPYEELITNGVFMVLLNSTDELSEKLNYVVDNFEILKLKAKNNRDIIFKMMSWETIKPNWYKYYELEPKL
jgi:glycosyltransferase involved in cell wall biosynthesis